MPQIDTELFGIVALVPLPAEAPIRETLEWKTDVMESHDGTEDRAQVRNSPRQSFDYSIPQQLADRTAVFNAEWGALRRRWAIPVWSQAQAIGAVAGGATSITCDTTNFELRDEGLALLFQSNSSYQLVEISAVGPTSITINAADAFSAAWLLPCRVGFLAGNVARKSTGHAATSQVVFEVDDNAELVPATPPQYLSEDIYFDEGLMSSSEYTQTLLAQSNVADYQTGLRAREAPWRFTKQMQAVRKLTTTPAELQALRAFLYRRAGKYRAFWGPTFEMDMRLLTTGMITTTFEVRADDYLSWASDRTHLAFQDTSGTWYARAIDSAAEVDESTTEITLTTALNVLGANVARICYLGRRRLLADSVDLMHIGNGVVTADLTLYELEP